MEKRNFLKGASVLLIAAVMIFSTFAVTANTEFKTDEKLIIESVSDNSELIRTIESVKEITEPCLVERVDFLGYDDGYTENAWAYTGGENWEAAIQLTDALLAPYRTEQITEVMFSAGCDVYGFEIADYEIWISDVLEDPTAPPVVYGTGTSSGTGWDTVTLDMAYDIPDTGDVYVGITYSNYGVGVAWPAGVDDTNYVPEGFWFYYSGVWQDGNGLLGPSVWGLSAGVTGGSPEVPDLDCDGTLSWTDVTPEETVTGTFTVENIGDPLSLLDWEIDSYPDWGTWTFDPDGGLDLTPEDGVITVDVEVVAPVDPETEFEGEIVLVNSDDPTDTCIIAAALVTPVSQQFIQASVANNFIQSSQAPYQPVGQLGSLYLQTPVGPDGSWTFTTSDVLLGYLVQDNFHDVTATIEDLHWWGVPLIYNAGWSQGYPEDLEFEVIFYEDDAGAPGAVVATYSNLFPTYTFYTTYAGLYDAYYWEIDGLDVDLAAGWLSIQSTSSPTSTSFLWSNSEDIPPGDGHSLQDGGALLYDEAFELTGGVPTIPDLDCDGTLSWIDVTPGETVAGTFTVENIGDDGSMLDWCIVSYPDWGTFTFDPDGGTGLPIGEVITVDVEVVAPDDPETEFEGEIVLENCDDPTDTCTINVALVTPQSQSLILQFLDMIAQRFPILGMILAALF